MRASPQVLSASTCTAIQLTGSWQVQPVPLDAPFDARFLGPDWLKMPACAHLQPVLYPDNPYWGDHLRPINQQAWIYRRTITVPDVPYKRARLRFAGVDYYAEVWVDDAFAGRHEGHFAPFELDVTHLLRGPEATLTVRVSAPWDPPNPSGAYPTDHVLRGLVKGLYEHGEGVIPPNANPIGIWRPVWLLLDDGISIDHLRIQTDLGGRVDVRLRVSNSTPDEWQGTLRLDVAARNHDGEGTYAQYHVTVPSGTQTIDRTLHIPDARLWWPWDHGLPNLYTLDAALVRETGETISTQEASFGVRTVRLDRSPEQFVYYVNERPVYIRGTSYMPALYLSECDARTLAADVEGARRAHLNLLRVHVHVSPPELYDLCDETGMLVWQDFELNWIQDRSPAFEARAQALQRDMIDLLGNHPAVITWACHNEPTMIFTRRHNLERHPDPALYADACAQDPTRPVFICSGQAEDDWRRSGDSHSYFGALWSEHYTDIYRRRPLLNTEFGFEAPAAVETLRAYPEVWERLSHLEGQIADLWAYQAALVQYHVEHFRRLRASGCAGYVHFWLVDLVPQVGCGVLDACRVPKSGYDALRMASGPILPALEHDGRRPIALWLFNDTDEDHPGATLRWHISGRHETILLQGETVCDIWANESQRVMPVHWMVEPAVCERITLRLYKANGKLLAENHYTRPFRPMLRPRGYPWKFDPVLGTKVFDRAGAPSLASLEEGGAVKWVPLSMREAFAEWMLRQRLPRWLLSAISRVVDAVRG